MLLTATRRGPLPQEDGRDSSTERTRLSGLGNIFITTPVCYTGVFKSHMDSTSYIFSVTSLTIGKIS